MNAKAGNHLNIVNEKLKEWECIEIICTKKGDASNKDEIVCKINGVQVNDAKISELVENFLDIIRAISCADRAHHMEQFETVCRINGARVDHLKVSDCIKILRASPDELTITLGNMCEEVHDCTKVVAEEPTEAAPTQQVDVEVEKYKNNPPTSFKSDIKDTQSSLKKLQEVENMYAKLERMKKVDRRLETCMSQFPNARVISFKKTGNVGIQVAGGNSLGIFVAAIREESAAAKEGVKPGDQILMCNKIDFEDITREEAVLILLALPDEVSLIVENKKETFGQIKKQLGDNFLIRVNFHHTVRTIPNELTFRKGEIFNVRDTMYQGMIGYWQAQRVGINGGMLDCGVVPNKSRAEQLALAHNIEEQQVAMPGRWIKRRPSLCTTLKKRKFLSQDRLDESSFADCLQVPAYERVALKVADFMRPVVILGALGDLIRLKLFKEMPEKFEIPSLVNLTISATDATPYDFAIKISEIRNVIAKNKHCLLDISPEGIEMLIHAQLCPIAILLNSTSRGAVKEMRASLVQELKTNSKGVAIDRDPATPKEVKKVFLNAKKVEELYPNMFIAKINTHTTGKNILNREFYDELKEIIFSQQAQYVWMPEEKPQETLDDIVFRPPNCVSYLSDAESDTEGESMTSSPVMAKKHYRDEDEKEEDGAKRSMDELKELVQSVEVEETEQIPKHYEIPAKKLTLNERMNNLASRIPSPQSSSDISASATTTTPRNYIEDMRNQIGEKNKLNAENIVIPSPEFPEVSGIEKTIAEDLPTISNGEGEPNVVTTARGFFDHRGGLLESVESKVSLFIPFGALPEGMMEEIFFKVFQDRCNIPTIDSNTEEILLSPLVMCGPHGLKFKKPVELRLPHRGRCNENTVFSLKSSECLVGGLDDWKNVKLEDIDVDGDRSYFVSEEDIFILLDRF